MVIQCDRTTHIVVPYQSFRGLKAITIPLECGRIERDTPAWVIPRKIVMTIHDRCAQPNLCFARNSTLYAQDEGTDVADSTSGCQKQCRNQRGNTRLPLYHLLVQARHYLEMWGHEICVHFPGIDVVEPLAVGKLLDTVITVEKIQSALTSMHMVPIVRSR
jgi:hypothetical protein